MSLKAEILEEKNKKLSVNIEVNETGLTWSCNSGGLQSRSSLAWRKLLATKATPFKDNWKLDVKYIDTIAKDGGVTMRVKTKCFFTSEEVCLKVSQQISDGLITYESQRTKKLVIFLNPKAGNWDAVSNYKKYVKPIFDLCQIEVDVIETQYEMHAEEILSTYDLSDIDVVASMGGDASYNQILTGLMKRFMTDHGLDLDDPSSEPVKLPIRFAALPNGSGCAVARTANSTIDIETCTINVVIGCTIPSDIMVVRGSEGLLGFSVYFISSGVITSTFSLIDSHRWLGKARYWFFAVTMFWLFTLYDMELKFRVAPKENLYREYAVPSKYKDIRKIDESSSGWFTIRDKISTIHILLGHMVKTYRFMKGNRYIRPCLTGAHFVVLLDHCQSILQLGSQYRDFMKYGTGQVLSTEKATLLECTECEVTVHTENRPYSNLVSLSSLEYFLTGAQTYRCQLFSQRFDMISIDIELAEEALKFES